MGDLASAFLAALPEGARAGVDEPSLEGSLRRLVQRATAAWPTLEVDAEAFVAHIAARSDPTDAAQWGTIAVEDLYLAFACSTGDPRALSGFERVYGPPVLVKAEKMVQEGVTADEVRQRVWHKLFVGLRGPPKIGDYSGRGPLLGWLSVITARTAIDLGRSAGSAAAKNLEQGLLDVHDDPELQYLKLHYREAFAVALQHAVQELTPKQRNLLAYSLVEGLDTNQIAGLYDAHRTSVGRWLAQAREDLLARTHTALMQRLSVSRSDVDSIMRLIGSRLDVTFRHLLRP